jgi:hypothetical protein
MTRYDILLGKEPLLAPPESVEPVNYFMGINFGMRSVGVIVGHLERMKTEYSIFKIDFINQNFPEQRDIFEWLQQIQKIYLYKGTLKIRANQRGYDNWYRHFERTDLPMELIPVTDSWRTELREQCGFFNILHGKRFHPTVNTKEFGDAYDLAFSGVIDSIREKYHVTNALIAQTVYAKMKFIPKFY